MTDPLLGRSLNRLEDERFLRGQGRYVADLAVPGALHGVVVRSTHAHARIVAVDVEKARAMPGVVAVFSSADLAADNIGPLPCAVTQIPMTSPLVVPPCHALARDIVRYVGEPVVFVVAESAQAARDAAEAVVVDTTPLTPVISLADAVMPAGPLIWPEGQTTSRSSSTAARAGRSRTRSARQPPCRGMRTGQQPRGGGVAGNARGARRVRRCERPAAPDGVGGRCACDPRLARRFGLSHSSRKIAGQHSRCRRRFRHEERALSGMGAGAVGGAAPEPPGDVDRRSQRRFPRLRAWPRQPRAGAACARSQRPFLALETKVLADSAPMSRRWRRSCRPWRWPARWAASTTSR